MKNAKMAIWVVVILVGLSVLPAFGLIQFNDGGTHDIDYTINTDVWVDWESPGMETTLNLLDGGLISNDYGLWGYEDSHLNISGGLVNDRVWAHDNSQIDFSGGSVGYDLIAEENGQIDFSGGSVGDDLIAYHNSQVDFSGGSVGDDLIVAYDGILTIYGSDFEVDGQPFGYGELTSILGGSWLNEPHRLLEGTLANGDPLVNDFYIGNNAKIVLTPEPATLLLLGLGAVMLRRKR